jgi:hypothetical protein
MARLTVLVLLLAAAAACTNSPSAAPATRAPQIRHLAAAIVLEAVISRRRLPPPPPPSTAVHGRCPAGFAALSGPDADPALCYQQLGGPMTITYAAISPVQQYSSQGPHGLLVTVRTGDRAALEAITTRAEGHQLAVIVASHAWSIPEINDGPLTLGQFEILVRTRQQADGLLRILEQPS